MSATVTTRSNGPLNDLNEPPPLLRLAVVAPNGKLTRPPVACMATRNDVGTSGVIVSIPSGEAILRRENREITFLVAREEITITHARYGAGEQVAGPHVHHEHTDAFYVLEGELTFVIGCEAETVTVSPGGFVAAPPGVAHSFRNDSGRPASWLTIHTPDGGFAAFMRGTRDGAEVEWDIAPVPAEGGLPASEAVVIPNVEGDFFAASADFARPS